MMHSMVTRMNGQHLHARAAVVLRFRDPVSGYSRQQLAQLFKRRAERSVPESLSRFAYHLC
jgi:hypothetical protein